MSILSCERLAQSVVKTVDSGNTFYVRIHRVDIVRHCFMLAGNDKALLRPANSQVLLSNLVPRLMHDLPALQWARRISGDANLSLTLISGDASFRRYFRGGGLVVDANPKTEKIMNSFAMRPPCTMRGRWPRGKGVDYEQGIAGGDGSGDTQLIGCLNDEERTGLVWQGHRPAARARRRGARARALR